MSKREHQLLQEVLALPRDVRAEMAEKLLESLEDAELSAIDKAWPKKRAQDGRHRIWPDGSRRWRRYFEKASASTVISRVRLTRLEQSGR